jgi:hypothetical protein
MWKKYLFSIIMTWRMPGSFKQLKIDVSAGEAFKVNGLIITTWPTATRYWNKCSDSCPHVNHEGTWRIRGIALFSLKLGNRCRWLDSFTPGHFNRGERGPDTHCISSWMGLRAGLVRLEKQYIAVDGKWNLILRSFSRSPTHYTVYNIQ